MSRAPSDCAWVTVMANINTLAVASLADASCIILAEGTDLDEMCRAKAKAQGICVFKTALPVFDAVQIIHYKHAQPLGQVMQLQLSHDRAGIL